MTSKVGGPATAIAISLMISSDFMADFCGFLLISKQGVRDFFRCGPLDDDDDNDDNDDNNNRRTKRLLYPLLRMRARGNNKIGDGN